MSMPKNEKSFGPALAVLVAVLVTLVAVAPVIAQDAAADRQAKIIANLKFHYPQLESVDVQINDLHDSGFAEFDQGTFLFSSQRGTQSQAFLVAKDDSKLFMIAGEPIDVSMTEEQRQVELANRKAEEAKEAAARAERLASAIEGVPTRGNPDAPVTIVEFSDFQCPYCARGTATLKEVLEKHGADVKVAFKHYPLDFHPWAKTAAIAAYCAAEQSQDAFWSLHDMYFAQQKQISPQNVLDKTREHLAGTGIDMAAWSVCAEDQDTEEYKAASAKINSDLALGGQLGVTGTPAFFVNGKFLNGAQPLENFEQAIADAKAGS